MATKRNLTAGRNRKRPPTGKSTETWRLFLGIWHQLRLRLPNPANAMRDAAANYTFLYRSAGAAIAGVPPVVISSYYQVATFSDEFRKGWPVLAAFLDGHVLIGCIVGGVWVFFVMWLRRLLASFVDTVPPGWDTAPSTILKAVDNVVGAKQQRFSDFLKRMGTTSPTPSAGDIFASITQPMHQISELVKGVYSTFDILLRGTLSSKSYTLKVNLATIDDKGKIASIPCHYPSNHPVRSTIDGLNVETSTIRCAVAARRAVVLESTLAEAAKAKPRFAVTAPTHSQEDGSLICYPVVLEGIDSVVFVLSVFVDLPGAFKPKHYRAYNEVIESFVLRLKLEYALLAIKEGSSS